MPQRNKIILKKGGQKVNFVKKFTQGVDTANKLANSAIEDTDKTLNAIDKMDVRAKGDPFKNADGSDKPRHYGGGGRLTK